MKRIGIMLLWLVVTTAAATSAWAQLEITSAHWKEIGGRRGCDATEQLIEACNGKQFCRMDVNRRNFCNYDPAKGRVKSLTIGYSCYGLPQPGLTFTEGTQATLRCEPRQYNGQHNGWDGRQHGGRDRLEIHSARWEVVANRRIGCDATRQVAAACDGKSGCKMRVDPGRLCNGDPAPNIVKQLRVHYSCNGDRQSPASALDFSDLRLQCGRTGHDGRWQDRNQSPAVTVPPAPVYRRKNLQIESATWAQVDGGNRWCDATPQMGNACNGWKYCSVRVDADHLCNGDPALNHLKNLTIRYTCDGRPRRSVSFADFAQAQLRCE
jgi:hypothetical protein